MTIESASYINELNPLYPADTDLVSELDDHLRLLKACLLLSFPKDLRNVSDAKQFQRIMYDGTAFANRDPPITSVNVGFSLVTDTFVSGTVSSILSDAEGVADIGGHPTTLVLTASTIRFRPFFSVPSGAGPMPGTYLVCELRRAGTTVVRFGGLQGTIEDLGCQIPGFCVPTITFAAADALTFHAVSNASGALTANFQLVFG